MRKLRFGTYLAPNIQPLYELVTKEVGKRLGIDTELVVETEYDSCVKDVNDVCFVCSLPYVIYENRGHSPTVPIAAPLLMASKWPDRPVRDGDRPLYWSDVIVHRDSPYKTFADLEGATWAFNEPWSQSGYGTTAYTLVKMGKTNKFFSRVIESGFHQESVRMVAHGEVDASAIDCQVLAVELRDNSDLAIRVRVIGFLGPSTIQPVAATKRLPAELRNDIQQVILELHKDKQAREVMRGVFVDRFLSVEPSSYDDIRMQHAAVQAAHFTLH